MQYPSRKKNPSLWDLISGDIGINDLKENLLGAGEIGLMAGHNLASLGEQGFNTLMSTGRRSVADTIKANEAIAAKERYQYHPTQDRTMEMAQNMSETLAPVTEAEAGVRQWMGDKEFNSPFWKMFPDEVRAGAGAVGSILPEIGESLLGLRTARSILGAGDIASAYKPGRRKEAGAVGGTRAKTYKPDVGTKARQMRDDGASRREIWDETFKMGQPTWFDPKDGRLQFEINDSGSRYIPYDERFKTLEDARVKSVEAQAKLKDINRGLKEQPDLFKQELTEAK